MKRSTDRILTTHVGSLARTPEILEGMKARTLNRPYDQDRLAADVRRGVAEVVRKQVEVGIDIPSDGEYARHGFVSYINDRIGGLEPRSLERPASSCRSTSGCSIHGAGCCSTPAAARAPRRSTVRSSRRSRR